MKYTKLWGIWSTVSRTFVFGIQERSRFLAWKKLRRKIGHDALKYRFEERRIKFEHEHMFLQGLKFKIGKEVYEMQSLFEKIKSLETRIVELENARSYVGCRIVNFNCNGYFGRNYKLNGAHITEDKGLRIAVRTYEDEYLTTQFDSFREKHTCLKDWMTNTDEPEEDYSGLLD